MAKKKKTAKEIDPDMAEAAELYGSETTAEEDDEASYVKRWILQCRDSADRAKFDRMQQNKQNFDVYQMRHDFSHKLPGQSRETLSMQPMAVESTASFFQQALIDEGDWWDAEPADPKSEATMKVTPDIVETLTNDQLEKAEMLRHVGLGAKSGILGGLMITKVGCRYASIPTFVANRAPNARRATLKKIDKKQWQLDLRLVNQQHYYPDPTLGRLYEIEDMFCDYRDLLDLPEEEGWDLACIAEVKPQKGEDDSEEKLDQRRRTDQNETALDFRNRVKLTEYWGTILDEDGCVLHENVVATLANDTYLIRPPTSNPFWHQESPYVLGALLDTPDAVWPKALADAGTKHNIALNEIYNLMLDGGMRSVNGVGMVRVDWLEDPAEIEGGIKPGTNLKVNSSCPPGAKVMEMVTSGTLPPDAQNMFNIMRQEFNAAMLTSDIRSGITPKRDQSATQIVETSQTITSVFKGITEQVEQRWIKGILRKSWMTTCQFSDEIDEHEVRALLGDRADAFLKLTPEERFAETVQGIKFHVMGITQHMAKAEDAQRINMLMQTVGGVQPLFEAYVKRFSVDELLYMYMKSLGLNTRRLEISQHEQELMQQPQQAAQPPGPQGPQDASQLPSPMNGSLQDQLGAAAGPQIPQSSFPASRATPAGGAQ